MNARTLNVGQEKVIRVLKQELTAREAFAAIRYIHQLPDSHWFWNSASAVKDAYKAAGALAFETSKP